MRANGSRPRAGRKLRGALVLALAVHAPLVVPRSVAAQAAGEPTRDSTRLFGRSDVTLLVALVGAQLLLYPLDDEIRAEAQRRRSATSNDVAGVVGPLGGAKVWYSASVATFALGALAGERRVADVGLHVLLSLAVAEAITGTLKAVSGRWRPRVVRIAGGDTAVSFPDPHGWRFWAGADDKARRAYPSGHATAAFTIASALSEELGGPTPFIAYPVAGAVAWSRLNDDAHWASDVTMGALVGIFSSRLVVRFGHRRGGPLERWLLLESDPASGGTLLGARVPVP